MKRVFTQTMRYNIDRTFLKTKSRVNVIVWFKLLSWFVKSWTSFRIVLSKMVWTWEPCSALVWCQNGEKDDSNAGFEPRIFCYWADILSQLGQKGRSLLGSFQILTRIKRLIDFIIVFFVKRPLLVASSIFLFPGLNLLRQLKYQSNINAKL